MFFFVFFAYLMRFIDMTSWPKPRLILSAPLCMLGSGSNFVMKSAMLPVHYC